MEWHGRGGHGLAGWNCDVVISYKQIADCAPPAERRGHLSRAFEIAQALDASGRLAPADQWMLKDLGRLIAEAGAK